MEKRVGAAEFYTAVLGMATIFTIVIFAGIFFYEKAFKKNDENLLTQK